MNRLLEEAEWLDQENSNFVEMRVAETVEI